MVLNGRPLLDTKSDAALFVDREDEQARVFHALNNGLNCLIHGEAGSGKSSLVRHVMYEARTNATINNGSDYNFTMVRTHGATTPRELLASIVEEFAGDSDSRTPAQLDELSIGALLDRLAEASQDSAPGERRVIVLDDPPARAANALLGGYRDDLWSIGLPWLVTVRTDDLHELLAPPANAFFETQVNLDTLGARAATRLLALRHQGLPSSVAAHAIEVSDGNPRRLLAALRDWVAAGESGAAWTNRIEQGRRIQTARLGDLGRSAHMLFVELQSLGSASASDEALLERMGWTRARASQVLTSLEQAGLVRGYNVKQDSGRPRRVFAPVPLDELVESVETSEGNGDG